MNMSIVCIIFLGIFCNLNICDMKECGKADNKRLLLHSESDVMNELLKLKSELANLTSDNNALKMQVTELQSKVNHLEQSDVASVHTRVGRLEQSLNNVINGLGNLTQDMTGSTYIRWGKNSCSSDSEVIYQGYIAGKYSSDPGSGTNHLCLPNDPTWANYDNITTSWRGTLFGTEINLQEPNPIFEYPVNNQDLPCTVCKSKRTTSLMIPARKNCYTGWTLEYWGYLMTSAYTTLRLPQTIFV
ncbi:uncharacterized protein LOC132756123 [Ruditapes philippinarum]|uniref:uncharacterized protein LOC132756123 n=1 Tax=Ruditapes philippinarum TaxID=129788 RepID=UPI00295AD94D|nr:uncharacterized protein LOC132756123 [Ruditapes philippinarum]